MKIEIIDTTLRDGEQAPGVFFTLKDKWIIAENLIELGIDEIEAGIPVMGRDHSDFIRSLARCSKKTRISAWSRFKLEDVKGVYKTGVNTIHISVPVSEYHLPNQLGSWGSILKQFNEIITYAKDHFEFVSLGLQDSFRSDKNRISQLCNLAEEFSLNRIRFSDTVGNTFPVYVGAFIMEMKSIFSGKIDFHGHNDLGLASANSLAALESWADSVNVTINGLGERAGNASLEQIAFIIDQHQYLESNIRIEGIKSLCQKVSSITRRPLALDKPIVGKNVFTHESGIHCHGQLKNSLAYQPFNPEDKGLDKSNLVVGTHSGQSGVVGILKSAGIDIPEVDIKKIMEKFKTESVNKKNYLTTEEVKKIYIEQLAGGVV